MDLYAVWTRDLVGPVNPLGSLATGEDDDMKIVVLRSDAEEAVKQAEQRVWDTAVVPRIGKDRFDQGYESGQRDMLAKCIAALPHDTHCLDTWYDDKTSECFCESAACDRALRALEEKPTPPPLPPSVGVPEKRGSLW
jgi:hypothetical protein